MAVNELIFPHSAFGYDRLLKDYLSTAPRQTGGDCHYEDALENYHINKRHVLYRPEYIIPHILNTLNTMPLECFFASQMRSFQDDGRYAEIDLQAKHIGMSEESLKKFRSKFIFGSDIHKAFMILEDAFKQHLLRLPKYVTTLQEEAEDMGLSKASLQLEFLRKILPRKEKLARTVINEFMPFYILHINQQTSSSPKTCPHAVALKSLFKDQSLMGSKDGNIAFADCPVGKMIWPLMRYEIIKSNGKFDARFTDRNAVLVSSLSQIARRPSPEQIAAPMAKAG